MDQLTLLAEQLTLGYFPNTTDPLLAKRLRQMLSCVRNDHQQYAQGPLRQSLIVAYLDPLAKPDRSRLWSGSRAFLRLQLANGLVYGLKLTGVVGPALQRLDQIAQWLLEKPFNVESFDMYAQHISEIVNVDKSVPDVCNVRLLLVAGLAPTPGISKIFVEKMCLAALNRLRSQYDYRQLNQLPGVLKQRFAEMFTATSTATLAYLAALDQDALSLVREFETKYHNRFDDLRAYNFLVEQNSMHCFNRVQAMRELPWLLRPLANMDAMYSTQVEEPAMPPMISPPAAAIILDAIDGGKPLFNAVSLAFDVPRETVRWTHYRMLPNVAQFDVRRIHLLLLMLSWLPREKRPETDAEWKTMKKVVCALFVMFSACWDADQFPDLLLQDSRYTPVFRRWLRELTRPNLAAAKRRIENLRENGNDESDMRDFLGALCHGIRSFGTPLFPNIDGATNSQVDQFLGWLGSQSLRQIAELSRRWHVALREQTRPVEPVCVSNSQPNEVWPAVLATPIYIGAYKIVELTSEKALTDEGWFMENCLASYVSRCVFSNRLIFSIRDTCDLRLSTVELALDEHLLSVSMQQHKGRKNAPAPEQCTGVVNHLLKTLNAAACRRALQARRDYQSSMRMRKDKEHERLRKDVRNHERMAMAAAWTVAFGIAPQSASECQVPMETAALKVA